MLIDCDGCTARGLACSDCVVTVLLGGGGQQLDGDEQRAIGVLADAGLVPPLRLVPGDQIGTGQDARVRKEEENAAEGFARARTAG